MHTGGLKNWKQFNMHTVMFIFLKYGTNHKQLFESQFSSVTQSCPTLWPHGLQYARLPYPSPTPGAYSNSCPLSRWCHPTISSSVVPFSSRLQSFPASGSFLVSHFFAPGGQSIGVSASASVLPMNIQDWFLQDELVGSPCSPRDSQESSPTPQFKSINSSALSFLYIFESRWFLGFLLTIKLYSLFNRQKCLKTEGQEEIPLDRINESCEDLWCQTGESGSSREQEPSHWSDKGCEEFYRDWDILWVGKGLFRCLLQC